ncbi:PQQ-binding-like beta-propeller repeat protein [candidate division WOR-3 bacterium]|nr:PQQ-binding-like beta-propeller repeat protein [candidate division WOR-3 bacterium]
MFFASSAKNEKCLHTIFFLLTGLLVLSCSSLHEAKYDFSIYGGSRDHSPYRTKGVEEFGKELFFAVQIRPVGVFIHETGYAVFASDGEILFFDPAAGTLSVIKETGRYFSSVIQSGQYFFAVCEDSVLIKLDAGFSLVWEVSLEEKIISLPVLNGGNLILITENGVRGVSSSDGSTEARVEGLNFTGCGRVSPLVNEGKMYVPSAGGEILCFDLKKFTLSWTYFTGSFFPVRSVPVMTGSRPSVFDCAGTFHILNPSDGSLYGKFRLLPISSPSFAAVDGDEVVVSSLFGDKIVFSYSLKNSEMNWIKKGFFGQPFIFKDALVVASDSSLTVLDKNGNVIESYTENSGVTSYFIHPQAFFMFSDEGLRIISK